MNLSRRGFLAGIIAAGVAPAIIRAGIIMPIKPALVVAAPPLVIERGGLLLMERNVPQICFGLVGLMPEGHPVLYDPFVKIRPEYRWVRTSLLGVPDPENVRAAQDAGWRAVPETERPRLVSTKILPA